MLSAVRPIPGSSASAIRVSLRRFEDSPPVSLRAVGSLLKATPLLFTRGAGIEEAESENGQSQNHIEIAVIAVPGQRMHKEFAHGLKVRWALVSLVGYAGLKVLLVEGSAFLSKSSGG